MDLWVSSGGVHNAGRAAVQSVCVANHGIPIGLQKPRRNERMSDSGYGSQEEDTDNDHEEEIEALGKKHAKKTEGRQKSKAKAKQNKQSGQRLAC